LLVKGIKYSPDEIIGQVLADKAFFEQSGGGITLSGGEVLLQAKQACALLRKAKEHGLHTAVETSGFAPLKIFAELLSCCDLLYLDIKLVNRERHHAVLGQYNDLILANLRYVAEKKASVIVRFPLIPGYTMDEENISAFITLLSPLNIPVEPLFFHQLGKTKYESIGKPYALSNLGALQREEGIPLVERFRKAKITVIGF
jgi:pyruvate formate lyase activating enzyme